MSSDQSKTSHLKIPDSKMVLVCHDCGKSKIVYKSQAKPGPSRRYKITDGIYRCKKCWDKKRKGGPHWNPNKGNKITVKCSNCGKEKTILQTQRKKYSDKYFCRKCYLELSHKGTIKYHPDTKQEVVCPKCGKVRRYKPSYAKKVGKYCMKCKNTGERNAAWKGGNVEVKCADCGKINKLRPGVARKYKDGSMLYRCKACSDKNKPCGPENHAWRGGISFAPYSMEWTPELRRKIRKRDNYVCQICGEHQPTSRKMPVHHIDYDKTNCSPQNLITLCGKCHTKTNYRRDHWQKHFSLIMENKPCTC